MVASPKPVNLNNEAELVQQVLRFLHTVRFGSIQLIIQDGRVIQIDKVEKVRLSRETIG